MSVLTDQTKTGIVVRNELSADDLPTSGLHFAHRGTSRDGRPFGLEGSRSAFRIAVALGADIIETDVRKTSDGVLVVGMHDATTASVSDVTVTVANTGIADLPQHYQPALVGSGWEREDFLTADEFFQDFGGRVVIDIELKNGVDDVSALAELVRKYRLERSVLVNTSSSSVAAAVVDAGLLLHYVNCRTTSMIDTAADAGAWMIDVPTDANEALVTYALGKNFRRVISGFVTTAGTATSMDTFSELSAIDSRLHGFASDAVGYLGRAGGEAQASAESIFGSIRTGRRGAGWKVVNSGAITDWLSPGSLYLFKSSTMSYVFGDLSGTRASTGTITAKFKYDTLPTTTTQYGAIKVFSTSEDPANPSADSVVGYKLGLQANGNLFLNRTDGASTGVATANGGGALVAGTEYTVTLEWDDTGGSNKVRITRVDTGTTSGWITEGATFYRGNYIGAFSTLSDGVLRLTDLSVE